MDRKMAPPPSAARIPIRQLIFAALSLFLATVELQTTISLQAAKMSLESRFILEPMTHFASNILAVSIGAQNVSSPANIVLSPISIHSALNLVLLGTNNESQTQQELNAALGFGLYNGSEINKCHEEYAKLLDDFQRATSKALGERKEYEANAKDMYGAEPSEPILDMFTMVIPNKSTNSSVLPGYEEKIKRYYASSIEPVNPDDAREVAKLLETLNEWAKKAEFKEPLMKAEELKEQFSAYVLSAIRVEAFWFDDFRESESEAAFRQEGRDMIPGRVLSHSSLRNARYIEFALADKAQYVDLNSQWRKPGRNPEENKETEMYQELAELNFQAIEVPLKGELSFVMLEPRQLNGSGGELRQLGEQLLTSCDTRTGSRLGKVLELLDSDSARVPLVRLSFPKFHFEEELDLKQSLAKLGIRRAFDSRRAEIYHMMNKHVYIDDIKHRAMIDVTKTGIKAAGVTKIKIMRLTASMSLREPINVEIKSPFMFVLRYKKLPLFVGQVARI